MKKYAITDIHGCNKTFQKLLDEIAFTTSDELFLLGDYIDRGPDSAGVISTILNLQEQGYTIHCLRGNHEQMMIDASDDTKIGSHEMWIRNGGKETLKSYFGTTYGDVPDAHLNFLDSLLICKVTADFVFVHAGLNFDMPNPLDGKHSMLWIRDWYRDINHHWLGGRIIIHGHTPQKRWRIEQRIKKLDQLPALNIDAGCVFDYADFGHLCAVDLDDFDLTFVKCVD